MTSDTLPLLETIASWCTIYIDYIYIHVCVYMCIYIYIHVYKFRQRVRVGESSERKHKEIETNWGKQQQKVEHLDCRFFFSNICFFQIHKVLSKAFVQNTE